MPESVIDFLEVADVEQNRGNWIPLSSWQVHLFSKASLVYNAISAEISTRYSFSKVQFMTRLFFLSTLCAAVSIVNACNATAADPPTEKKTDGASRAIAVKGTPEIDGEVDDSWKTTPRVSVSKPIPGLLLIDEEEMATAKVRLMWDEENVYALWQVTDSELSASGSDPWTQDSVELFLDENIGRTFSYESDDAQYRVNFEGLISGQGPGYEESRVTAIAKKSKTGYVVEMAVRVHDLKLTKGMKLGIEFQVNDDHGSGDREALAKWNHTEDDSWDDTSNFGTLLLKETHEMKKRKKAKPVAEGK